MISRSYALTHLGFYLAHLGGMSAGGTAFLVTALALLPAIAAGLLVLSFRRAAPPGG